MLVKCTTPESSFEWRLGLNKTGGKEILYCNRYSFAYETPNTYELLIR